MSSNTPRGFVAHSHLGGHHNPTLRRRQVKANRAGGGLQIFAGDPVVLASGNTVSRADADTTAPVVGVVAHVLNNASFGPQARPLTHQLPDGAAFIGVSAAGWVDVIEDPDQLYLLNTASTVTSTHIGQFITATAGSPNTAAGRSGFNGAMGTAQNTAATTVPYQIVEIAPDNLDGIVGGENNQNVLVRLASHSFRTIAASAAAAAR